MNQIKQKIEEIGLSQRDISKRLGKNASYLAGVFRTGLSTAKQAELMDDLEIVAGGGTILSDEKLLELVDDVVAVERGNYGHGDGHEEPEPRQTVALGE